MMDECGPLEDAWAQICPESEAERIECEHEMQDKNTEINAIPDLLTNRTESRITFY